MAHRPNGAPTIILLHEGLGSAALWGDFPDKLQAATGAGVFVYSRAGYGVSSPVKLPRPVDYMHREALDVLPKLLEAIGFRRGLLVGHSDGASIAAIYAGGVQDHRVRAIALMAPHFIVEDISVTSIAGIRKTYETTNLREKLARWHKDVDNAFYGWNGAWLDPQFRSWDISEYLAYIRDTDCRYPGCRRPVWHAAAGRDCAGRVLLSGRRDDPGWDRTFAVS